MKAVVAAFNQEKVLKGAFSAITNLRMELFEALPVDVGAAEAGGEVGAGAGAVLGGVGGCGAGDVTQRLGHGRDVDSQVPEQVGCHAQVERNSEEEK